MCQAPGIAAFAAASPMALAPQPQIVYLMVILAWIAVVILELTHAPRLDFLEGLSCI